jgi:hypothetical protein
LENALCCDAHDPACDDALTALCAAPDHDATESEQQAPTRCRVTSKRYHTREIVAWFLFVHPTITAGTKPTVSKAERQKALEDAEDLGAQSEIGFNPVSARDIER